MSRSSPARQGDQQGESSIVPGDRLRSAAEAILVVADEPVTTAALSEALGLEETATEELLESLAVEYSGHDGTGRSRGFVLRRAAGGWRLASAPEFSEIVERFVVGGATARLSQAALETLAIIAYRQPITRSRVSRVRGVGVDAVVRTLMARGLIAEVGETESGARLYGTTSEFLEKMGLGSLEDLVPLAPYLPAAEELDDLEDQL